MIKIFKERSFYKWILIFSVASFFIIAFFSSLFRSFNHDEFEAIHSAWKVFSGDKIYIDFLQHHHFLLYYMLTTILAIFGASVKSIIASRILMFLFAVAIVWLTYKIAELIYNKQVALLSIFFLSTAVIFIQKIIEVRPDVPLVCSCLIAILFLLKHFKTRQIHYLLLSASFLFIAFLFLQKAIFLAIIFGLIFIYRIYKKQTSYKEFFLYWGLFLAYLGFFILYVSLKFSLSEYVFMNWMINTKLLNTFPLYKYFIISAGQNPLLWSLYFFGILALIYKRSFDIIAFISLGLLGFIFFTKSPFPQYYLMSIPLVAIVAATQADKFLENKKFIMTIFLFLSMSGSVFSIWHIWEENTRQLNKINYVLSITTPDDFIYDGDANFNIFRKDIDYFWYSVKPKTGVLESYKLMRNYNYDVYKLIGDFKPKVVSNSFIKTKNEAIANYYTKSEVFSDLYIRK